MKFLVFVKQIPDPDIPPTQFRIDPATNNIVPRPALPRLSARMTNWP